MKFVRYAILLTTAVVVPLIPTAAQANRYSFGDAAADVISIAPAATTGTPTPDRVAGDVISSTVNHKRRAVVMRLQYRDLAAETEVEVHLFAIRTNQMKRYVTVYAAPASVQGKVLMTNPHQKKVRCRIAGGIDYTLNTVTVIVPRSCLGNPRWVRVGMAGIVPGATETDPYFVDDARTTGTIGNDPAYGPKVRR